MWIFVLFLAPFFLVGLINIIRYIVRKNKCTASVTGTVIDIQRHVSNDSDGGTSETLHPVFEYEVDGEFYTKVSSVGFSGCKYKIGQEVVVLYDPDNPEKYLIEGDKSTLRFGIIFLIGTIFMGLVFIYRFVK